MKLFRYPFCKIIVSITTALWLVSCVHDTNPTRPIRQANLVFEDNVNGRIFVKESTNFYYNPDGSLGRVTEYDDTTLSAILLKDITVQYDSNKVILNTFHYIDGYRVLYLYFNDKNQITQLVDTLGNGIYFNYTGDKIESYIDSSSLGVLSYVNFLYDAGNNLLQYEVSINYGTPFGRAFLEYSSNPVTEELDTRFFNKDIKFIYIGGLNLVTKLGLNFGTSNSNTLIKRTEMALPSTTTIETYNFDYTYNENHEIIKRNMRWSTDTLFYHFRY